VRLMLRKSLARQEHGDTLVEVLIAMAVISLVLAGAYVTTNRSLLAARDAQERGNALKLVESQIEQLKGVVANDPDAIFVSAPSPFCIINTNAVTTSTDPKCKVDGSGNPTTVEPAYELGIVRDAGTDTFTITNRWTSVRGDVTNQVQMKYRMHQ